MLTYKQDSIRLEAIAYAQKVNNWLDCAWRPKLSREKLSESSSMTLRQALARKGHNNERIDFIINEAKNSSNAAYILSYWGVDGEKHAKELTA